MNKLQRARWSFLAAAGTMGFVIAAPPSLAGDVVVHIGIGAPAPQPVIYQYVYYPLLCRNPDAAVRHSVESGLTCSTR